MKLSETILMAFNVHLSRIGLIAIFYNLGVLLPSHLLHQYLLIRIPQRISQVSI